MSQPAILARRSIFMCFKLLERPKIGLRLLFFALRLPSGAAAAIGFGIVRIEAQRLGIIGDGMVLIAFLREGMTTIDIKPNVLGIESDRRIIIGDRPDIISSLSEVAAPIGECNDIVWVMAQSLVAIGDGIVETALLQPGPGAVGIG